MENCEGNTKNLTPLLTLSKNEKPQLLLSGENLGFKSQDINYHIPPMLSFQYISGL